MIIRPKYMEFIRPYFDTPFVKILTGIRRCGKSTILEMIMNELLDKGIKKENVIYLHLDSFINDDITTGKKLYEFISERIKDEKVYIFIDEVQEATGWEKAINSLMVDYDVDIYVTGSNSKLLSSEISTYLTGRYISIPVYTLSYEEYLSFKKETKQFIQEKDYIKDYIEYGGFPSIALQSFSRNEAYTVVKDIYNSVIFTDIVKRNSIRKVDLFERVVKFIFENIGKTFSASSITAFFKSEERMVDKETLYNYISYLEKAYIIYRANRYDIQGKEVLKTQEKYYLSETLWVSSLIHHSLKYSMLSFNSKMIASVLENIVFLELRRRHYDVYIGKFKTKEIDFVATKNSKKIYVQVCRNLPEDSDREIQNLKEIEDNYPKYIVTLDKYDSGNIDGIEIVYLEDFLLKNEY